LRAKFEKWKDDAKRQNARPETFDDIQRDYQRESDFIWHPIYARDSDKLVALAHKYQVRVPALPNRFTDDDNKDWDISNVTGDVFLTDEAEDRLKREIRIEKRQNYDEVRKWAAVIISLAAFYLALTAFRAKQKQPDPCPRNYYRSDSGECLFALQKTSTTQQKQTSPANSKP